MLNIMKADLYRVSRGKGVYIILFVFAVIAVFQALFGHAGQFGVMVTSNTRVVSVDYDEYGNETVIYDSRPDPFTGKIAPLELAQSTDNIIWFVLAFIAIIAADFSDGTAKNFIMNGFSRFKYFGAKLITSGLFCVLLFLLYIIIPILTATIARGFGGGFDLAYLGEIAKIYLPQLYLALAFVCVGVFLIFTFKRTAFLNTAYIAVSLLPIFVFSLIAMENEKLSNLIYYALIMNMKSYADYAEANLTRTLLLGGAIMAAAVFGGLTLFRKSEIK